MSLKTTGAAGTASFTPRGTDNTRHVVQDLFGDDPSTSRSNPERPCVPMTRRSLGSLSAVARISPTVLPSMISSCSGRPPTPSSSAKRLIDAHRSQTDPSASSAPGRCAVVNSGRCGNSPISGGSRPALCGARSQHGVATATACRQAPSWIGSRRFGGLQHCCQVLLRFRLRTDPRQPRHPIGRHAGTHVQPLGQGDMS